jgi:hypothetical protein
LKLNPKTKTSSRGGGSTGPGNLHSAGGCYNVPVVSRYPGKVSRTYFRADAGFANPEVEVYDHLEAGGRMRSDQQTAGR